MYGHLLSILHSGGSHPTAFFIPDMSKVFVINYCSSPSCLVVKCKDLIFSFPLPKKQAQGKTKTKWSGMSLSFPLSHFHSSLVVVFTTKHRK